MLLSKVRTKTVKAALSCNMADKWISFFYFFLKKRFLNISNGFLYSCQITQLNEKFCCSFVLFNCWFLQCNLTSMVTKKVNLKHIFFVTGTCGGCTCTLYLAQFSQNFIRSFYILMIFFAYVTYFEIHCLKKMHFYCPAFLPLVLLSGAPFRGQQQLICFHLTLSSGPSSVTPPLCISSITTFILL